MRFLRSFLEPLKGNRQLCVLLILSSLVMSGVSLVAPVMPIYASLFSASSTMIGLVITVFGLGRLVSSFPTGILAYRIGRKSLFIASTLLMTISSVGAALVTSFDWLLIWRFAQGVVSGAYMTLAAATIASLTHEGNRGRIMGLYQACIFLGAGIGPAIGGGLAQIFGLTAPLWGYAAMGMVAFLVACFGTLPASKHESEAQPTTHDNRSLRQTLFHPTYIMLCAVTFAVFFTRTASIFQIIPLFGHNEHDLDLGEIGMMLSVLSLVTFAILPLSSYLVDRFGSVIIIFLGCSLSAASLALIGLSSDIYLFWLGTVGVGIAVGINSPATGSFAAEIIPRRFYDPGIGFMRTCGDVGFVVGPIIVGMIDDFTPYGMTGGLFFNACIAIASGAGLLLVGKLIRRMT